MQIEPQPDDEQQQGDPHARQQIDLVGRGNPLHAGRSGDDADGDECHNQRLPKEECGRTGNRREREYGADFVEDGIERGHSADSRVSASDSGGSNRRRQFTRNTPVLVYTRY